MSRKVRLNGLPIPEGKPQATEETDQEPEQTYVDVYDLHLMNSVSDVYVPLPGNELALTVQRVLDSEIWSTRPGMKAWELPDRPFGPCWKSNLCAYLRFGFKVTKNPSQPDWVEIVDENGTSFRFVMIWKRSEPPAPGEDPPPPVPYFLPMPSNRTQQDNYLMQLKVNPGLPPDDKFDPSEPAAWMSQWTFEFTRKFGTKLVFEKTTVERNYSLDPADPGSGKERQFFFYCRLALVTDRFGNKISYEPDVALVTPEGIATTLLPRRIVSNKSFSLSERTIEILSEPPPPAVLAAVPAAWADSLRRVYRVYDVRGKITDYTYSTSPIPPITGPGLSSGTVLLYPLTEVARPEGMKSVYSYEAAAEKDTAPRGGSDPENWFFHIDLNSIKDSAGIGYHFFYRDDKSYLVWSADPNKSPTGWYASAGHRRLITKVTLPGGGESQWEAPGEQWVPINYQTAAGNILYVVGAKRKVTDAAGKFREWEFTEPDVLPSDEITNLLYPTEDALRNLTYQVVWSKTTFYNPLIIGDIDRVTEIAKYDVGAGLSLLWQDDFCGHRTEWEYADSWRVQDLPDFAWLPPAPFFFTKWPDPTKQTRYLRQGSDPIEPPVVLTKEFNYHSSNPSVAFGRIMKEVTDEEGRRTEYTINATTGNRTQERVFSASNLQVRETNFGYDGFFKAFLTRRETVNGLVTESGNAMLVEEFTPDDYGNVRKEIQGDDGVTFQFQVSEHGYDAAGNRIWTKDGESNVTHFVYDDANRLVTTRLPIGSPYSAEIKFEYDPRGNKTKETDANNHSTNFYYDGQNRLTTSERVMEAGLLTTEHTYNEVGSRLTTRDPNGNLSTWTFDALQRPVTMVQKPDAGTSYLTEYFYDRASNCGTSSFDTSSFKATRAKHPKVLVPGYYATTLLKFDSLYREIENTQDYERYELATTFTEYDKVGNPVKVTDPEGLVTEHTYDAENRLLKTTWPSAPAGPLSVHKTWTPAGLAITDTNERGAVTRYAYDKAGRLSHTWAPNPVDGAYSPGASPLVRNFYDRVGNVVKTINPLGAEWDYFYDAMNRRWKELLPSAIDADQVTFPLVRAEDITEYDDVGNVTAGYDARGNQTLSYYDYANRLIEVHVPQAAVHGVGPLQYGITKTTYDNNGNPLTVTDPESNKTENTYDGLNRLLSTKIWSTRSGGPDPTVYILTEFTYDEVGNRISVKDGEGHETTFRYDGLNRLTRTTFDSGTAFSSSITELWGPLTKISRTEPGARLTNYTYDFRHRLEKVRYDGASAHGENRTYNYDLAGNLLSVVHPHATDTLTDTATTWDYLNRALTETSAGCVHHYTYDKAGNRTQTLYDGGRKLVCTYDALNRLDTCTESHPATGEPSRASKYLYDRDGHTVFKLLPGGTLETRTWDSRGRATVQRTNAPGTLTWPPATGTPGAIITEQYYGYDNTGNVREIIEHTRAGGASALALPDRIVTNVYDDAYRLIKEEVLTYTTPTRLETTWYGYDRAGNRIQKECDFGPPEEDGITTCEYTGPANQVSKYLRADGSRVFYLYNAYGCRSHRWVVAAGQPDPVVTPPPNADTFTWDRENRLVSSLIQQPAPPAVPRQNGIYTFRYDARTRRVRRHTPGLNTRLSFSGGLSVQEYYTPSGGSGSGGGSSDSSSAGDGGPDVEYIRGSDYGGGVGGILYSIRKTIGAGGSVTRTASCNHYNSRGDVITKSAASTGATVLWTAAYQAFGTRPEEKGTNPDPQRANTKEEDGTGLLNEGYRYRCIETGMFVSRDPAGFIDGPNLYTYVVQNPWTRWDPSGLGWWDNAVAFGRGALKGAAIAVAAVVIVAAVAVVAPAIAVVTATTLAVVGVAGAVKSGYEIISGNEAFTGRELSDEERWELGGEFLGGMVGGAAASRHVPGLVQSARIRMGKGDGGKSFDNRVGTALEKTHGEIEPQVQVKLSDGSKVNPDYVGTSKKSGGREAVEAKSTQKEMDKALAGDTPQSKKYETLSKEGGEVRSTKKPTLPQGTQMLPTPVNYVGPRELHKMENPFPFRVGQSLTGTLAGSKKPEKPKGD